MKLPNYSWLILLAVAAATSLSAAEITGKVRDASGDMATVVIEGDALPAVGDSAEIFFKIQGADEEISVASGKVAAVEAKVVKVKIDKATGTIEKDHLARIKSGSPPSTSAASPPPAASPAAPAPKGPSIVGEWVATSDKEKRTCVFREDGTTSWTADLAGQTLKMNAKYRVDYTKTPYQIDIEEIDHPSAEGLYGIFEFEADGTIKFNISEKASTRPTAFNQYTTVYSRAQVPAGTTASTSSSPSGTAKAAAQPSIIGDWVGTAPDGSSLFFSFKADGTVRWGFEDAKYTQSVSAKYRIDSSTQPQSIEMFDIEEGKGIDKGERAPGIFEFQSDGRLKLEFRQGTQALKEFSKNALVFSRATSPLVPSNKPPPPTPAPYVAPTPAPDEKLVEEAYDLYGRKDYDGAIKLYTKAIELNPKNARAFFRRAMLFDLKQDYKAALADYEKAQELDPSLKLEDSIKITKRVLDLEPEKPAALAPGLTDEALVDEGFQRYQRGDDAGAIEAFDKAIMLNPKNARAYHWRGRCLSRLRKITAAIADYEKAMELDPTDDLRELIKTTKELFRDSESAKPNASPTRTKKKGKP